MTLKKLGKAWLCRRLEAQVLQLRERYDFTIVVVAGSVGKTSSKLAIAKTLAAGARVQFQDGNYNDRLTVPLAVFGQSEPPIFNILAWLKLLRANQKIIKNGYPYDIVVLELGTDGPGQMKAFAYLHPELLVLTSIADEHMEFFGNLDTVATEELEPLQYAKRALLNIDDIPEKYLPELPVARYGLGQSADYQVTKRQSRQLMGQSLTIRLAAAGTIETHVSLLGTQGAKIVLAAASTAHLLGWEPAKIQKALGAIQPVAGRMQIIAGLNKSTLIDDTYNASPVAVLAAVEVLADTEAKQRIAILGTMNELGDGTAAAHQAIGAACDPAKIDLVVTIGNNAEKYLAPTARARGCEVRCFASPYEAGDAVKVLLKPGTVVLAKGSQNGVFAEEALKQLLASPRDAKKLVRQSAYWLGVKAKQFPPK